MFEFEENYRKNIVRKIEWILIAYRKNININHTKKDHLRSFFVGLILKCQPEAKGKRTTSQ